MPPRRKIRSAAKVAPIPVVVDKTSDSSWLSALRFWLLLALLCLGGYIYYQHAQERNQEARAELEECNQANKQKREANELKAWQRARDKRQKPQDGKSEEPHVAEQELAESDAELAAREAKERELILEAEKLNQLREIADREEMLNPYRDEESEPLPENAAGPVKNAVVSALEQFDVFNAKPKENAEYYIYLCSASWCGQCFFELKSTVVREYKEIRKNPKVELILISFDRSLEAARALPKKTKLKCPTLWVEDMRKKVFQRLPGFEDDGNGIPYVFIVDKDGQLIIRGHGSFLYDWKRIVDEVEKHSQLEGNEAT